MASKNTTKEMKGRRTGVTVAPPGKIPVDGDGMEDLDAFWKSESGEAEGGTQANERQKRPEKTKRRQDISPVPKPNFDLFRRDNNSGALTETEKKRSADLARRALERQARLSKRGLLSPEDQSVATDATDATELSAIDAVSVASPMLVALTPVAKRRENVEEHKINSAGSKKSPNDPVSPMTPAAFSIASEEHSGQKRDKLDSLLEEKMEKEEAEEASNEYPQENSPDSEEQVDFGDGGGNFGYEDNNYSDGGDNEGDGFQVAHGHSSSEEEEVVVPAVAHRRMKVSEDEDEDDIDEPVSREDESASASMVIEETPQKVREERARKERKKLLADVEKKKKRKKKKKSTSSVVSFSSPASAYIASGPRDYESIPISEFKSEGYDSDEEPGLRRSKRARFRPLQYWKNERLVYEANEEPEILGDMAVVTKVQKALPTPMKKIKRGKTKKKKDYDSSDDEEENLKRSNDKKVVQKKFDKRKLKKDYIYKTDENALIWDEGTREFSERKIVAYAKNMEFLKLPVTQKREKGESKKCGKAVQAFNVPEIADNIPGWISGKMEIPPTGIKDAENVGVCSQVFFVGNCQPGAFEVAIASPEDDEFDPITAQRFMVSSGDFFHVPPNNIYRVENHSETDDATLFWCIIRPTSS